MDILLRDVDNNAFVRIKEEHIPLPTMPTRTLEGRSSGTGSSQVGKETAEGRKLSRKNGEKGEGIGFRRVTERPRDRPTGILLTF